MTQAMINACHERERQRILAAKLADNQKAAEFVNHLTPEQAYGYIQLLAIGEGYESAFLSMRGCPDGAVRAEIANIVNQKFKITIAALTAIFSKP